MERRILISGTGKLAVPPDMIQIFLTLKGTHDTYSGALEESANAVKKLTEALAGAGFGERDLKTTFFSVDSRYEDHQDSSGQYSQRFVGFGYDHRLKLEIDQDSQLLGKALEAFLQSGVPVEFQLVYTIRDPGSVKNELLRRAIREARKGADHLADAAGVRLGKIIHIHYPGQDQPFGREVMRSVSADSPGHYTAAAGPSIEPESLELTESVRVTWEIL